MSIPRLPGRNEPEPDTETETETETDAEPGAAAPEPVAGPTAAPFAPPFTPTFVTSDAPSQAAPPAESDDAPAAPGGAAGFFEDAASEKLRDRWQTIQIDFVDDPRRAVEQAEALVEQVSTQLTESIAARRRELHGRWSKGGTTASAAHDDGVATEDLRVALRGYREVFHQLLSR